MASIEKAKERITKEQYLADRNAKTTGTSNPSVMDKPFWKYMIKNGQGAYHARQAFNDKYKGTIEETRVWCFSRFGRTVTTLNDGRIVMIGGEHEDFYDPDFQIYNDVVVSSHAIPSLANPYLDLDAESEENAVTAKLELTIYGYPQDVFPPIDFHTATYFADGGKEYIYVIGGEGYQGQASRVQTDVYRLDLSDFSFTKMETSGLGKPEGGLCHHSADLINIGNEPGIKITVYEADDGLTPESERVEKETLCLALNDMRWITPGTAVWDRPW